MRTEFITIPNADIIKFLLPLCIEIDQSRTVFFIILFATISVEKPNNSSNINTRLKNNFYRSIDPSS